MILTEKEVLEIVEKYKRRFPKIKDTLTKIQFSPRWRKLEACAQFKIHNSPRTISSVLLPLKRSFINMLCDKLLFLLYHRIQLFNRISF